MKKSIFFTSIFCLIISFPLFAQQEWIMFTSSHPGPPTITLDSMTSQGIYFQVEIPGMYREPKRIDGEFFYRLSLVNGIRPGKVGSPEIPQYCRLTGFPESDGMTINIVKQDSILYESYNVCPVPELVKDSSNGYCELIEVFTKDQQAYERDKFFPGLIGNISYPGYVRGQKVGQTEIHPLQYNPATQILKAYPHFQVQITFNNPHSPLVKNTGIFENVVSQVLINHPTTKDSLKKINSPTNSGSVTWFDLTGVEDAPQIVADYLIISDHQFIGSHNADLQRIANHRAAYNGFDVVIIDVQQILLLGFEYENSDFQIEQKIRSFIKLVYEGTDGTGNAAHTYDGHLAYVLLVGDAFPHPSTDGVPASNDPVPGSGGDPGVTELSGNDYYYSCVTKVSGEWDLYGDLYIGRFPVDNSIELYNIVEKTIYNETQVTNDSWKHKNYLICGYQNDETVNESFFVNDFYNYVDGLYDLPYRTYLWDSQCNSNGVEEVINFINDPGCNTVIYYGHGKTDQWDCIGNIGFFESHLQNWSKYPFVCAYACATAAFTNVETVPDCIAEEMVTFSPSAGYSAYLGANKWIFMNYTENDFYPWKMYRSIFHDLSHIAGEFVLEAKLSIPNVAGDDNEKFTYNLLGDPALNIFSPGFEVTKDMTLTPGLYEDEPSRVEPIKISDAIYVRYGSSLIISHNSHVYFEKGGQIIVDPDGTLALCNEVTFHGKDPQNDIYVEGDLHGIPDIGVSGDDIAGVKLFSLEGTSWNGIELYNPTYLGVFNNVSFKHCNLTGSASLIDIQQSTFQFSRLSINESNFSMYNCQLDYSSIDLHDYSGNSHLASITTAESIHHPDQSSIIKIRGYSDFILHDLKLHDFGTGTGIELIDCGLPTSSANHIIDQCNIHNEGSSLTSYGIKINHSNVFVTDNYIYHNRYGILCDFIDEDNNVIIQGDPDAQNNEGTQRIIDNYENQIRIGNSVFPCIHFNVIQNSLSIDPLIYYDWIPDPKGRWDIRCNCLPSNPPLYPSAGGYDYTSIWCPPAYCEYGCDLKKSESSDNSGLSANQSNSDNMNQSSFQLYQNVPNPFSALTRIAFTVPYGCKVRLFLTDLTGRLIKILEQNYFEQGTYSFEPDLSDLDSGNFLVSLLADDKEVSRIKIIKIK